MPRCGAIQPVDEQEGERGEADSKCAFRIHQADAHRISAVIIHDKNRPRAREEKDE